MIKINRKVEYALMALKYIAQKDPGELTSARELVDNFNIPFDTVSKVLQILANNKIVTSQKGINGGYVLEGYLENVTFLNLVEWIEGKKFASVCQSSKGLCELYGNCNIISPVETLNQKVVGFFERLSLQELLLDPNFNQKDFNQISERQL